MFEVIQSILNGFQLMPPVTKYILLASVAVAIFTFIYRIMKKIKKAAKIMADKKYRKNPSGFGLASNRQAALNVGAINGEQTMFYTDSLSTGGDKFTLKEALASYYGVESEPGSAERTLKWLYTEGHRVYFDIIRQNFSAGGEHASAQHCAQEIVIDPEKLRQFQSNLEESVSDLIRVGFIKAQEDIASMSIAAWDMGRLVTVTRCCFECGYITEERAWELLEAAYEQSKEVYADWKDFAAGYIVGRAMWGGYSVSLEGLMTIARELLEDEDSPWRQTALR